jgi:alanyl-tRNA synthetase
VAVTHFLLVWSKAMLHVKIKIMERLYWTDPDAFEVEVEVKSLDGCKVTIQPLIFHPNEGGQPADKGTIGQATVCNVEMVDGRIVHTLDKPLPDGKYVARIDKQHRLYTAAQHTAQHIISGIAEKQFGLRTTGVHIGLEKSTVDFDSKIDWEIAAAIERRSNEVACLDIPVETVFNDANVRVRSASGKIESDTIRVVKIGEYDKSACCGAHLRSTGRIGVIRILSIESKKEGTRMVFLAGDRAVEYSQLESAILRELRKIAGCATAELPAQLQKALDRAGELSKEIERMWSMLLPGLVESARVIEVESSKVGIQVTEIPTGLLAKLAALIAEATGGAGVVVSGLGIAVCSSQADAREILKRIQNTAGGKGGGSPKAANGRLAKTLSTDEITAILRSSTK